MENLLFGWTELKLETISAQDRVITVSAAPIALEATCPDCQQSSARVHSRYQRSLADLPCCGKVVRLLILVRRFFCLNQNCSRRLFAEQLPTVMARYARRTRRHNQALETIGLALGGEAGQRTAGGLGFEVSADTLLRRARSVPDPDNVTVRVLGVDDFAFRRGSRYGTILIDQEKREPIDLLPDREAKTLREWLAAHPEVEVITRDRSPAYAEGARQGAPQATQVADRFHLMKNLREAVERVLIPRHAALREAAREISPRYQTEQMLRAEGLIEALPARPAGNKPRMQQLGEQRREQRMARYQGVKDLKRQGLPIRQIARRLGLHRETVRNFLRAEAFPERATPIPRPTMVEKFADYLKKRWQEGCENGKQLYEEISAQGFKGSPATLRRYLRNWRRQLPEVFQKMKQLPDFPPPSPRQASWWLLKQTDELEKQEREYVKELTRLNPEIKTAEILAKGFQELARQRREQSFDQWREEVNQSGLAELKSFADSLMTDEAAVREALRSEWSNGQTEGQINRLKMIKRTMFGRAKLDLLRARVLHAP